MYFFFAIKFGVKNNTNILYDYIHTFPFPPALISFFAPFPLHPATLSLKKDGAMYKKLLRGGFCRSEIFGESSRHMGRGMMMSYELNCQRFAHIYNQMPHSRIQVF